MLSSSEQRRNYVSSLSSNHNDSHYTGGGSGTAYISNTEQSTTGNVYGIYDMSGGSWEYVASYINNGVNLINSSEHLKQLYSKGNDDSIEMNYQANKGIYGDAVYETSMEGSYSVGSWYGDYAFFPDTRAPFFERGGYYIDNWNGGLVFNGNESSNEDSSFRLVLVTSTM